MLRMSPTSFQGGFMFIQRGFTLIELLTTITIVAVVTMMAAPSFSELNKQYQLNSSSRTLAEAMFKARAQAALLNREITVKLASSDADTDRIFNWKPKGDAVLKGTTTSVVFRANGSVAQAVNILVCNSANTKSYTVSVSILGTVQQKKGSCS